MPSFTNGNNGDSHDLELAWSVLDPNIYDDEDTEQHKAHRDEVLQKPSIQHYRHATGRWGAALESFSPMWFAICISSGGLAVLLSEFPYPAHWLRIIASILYVLELILFVTFLIIMIARWTIYPHIAVRRAAKDPNELGAYAVPPIALLTLSALTATQVSTTSWGGHAFAVVAYALWWIGVVWIFTTAVTVSTVLFYTGNQSDHTLTPVLFMAPVGLATAGVEAATVCLRGVGLQAHQIGPALVIGYFATGIAMFMAILLYTLFFHRLLSSGWPPAAVRPGMFILVGLCIVLRRYQRPTDL